MNISTELNLSSNSLDMNVSNFINGNLSRILLTDTTMSFISTNSGFAGAQYSNDFSANFTNRSLIDKGYADANYLTTASSIIKKYYTNKTFVLNTPLTVTHSIGTISYIVQLWDNATGDFIIGQFSNRTNNSVDITLTQTYNSPGIDIIVIG